MENEITAHKGGTVKELPIAEGAQIQAGAPIATITSARERLTRRARRRVKPALLSARRSSLAHRAHARP